MPWTAVTCVLVLTLVVAAPAASSKRNACDRRGATIVANARARLFSRADVGSADEVDYGCVRRGGRIRELAFAGGGGSHEFSGPFQLKGTLAGFAQTSCLDDDCSYTAKSLDLRTGRVVQKLSGPGYPEGLVMSSRGSLVVLAVVFTTPQQYEVRRVNRSGRALLDSGPDIDPHSLALGGSYVYWLRGGRPRFARID